MSAQPKTEIAELPFKPTGQPSTKVRCGTHSGWSYHVARQEKPCDACAAARAEYDRRLLAAPEATRKNRLHARAQQRALKRLKDAHADEYARLYAEAKVEVGLTSPPGTAPGGAAE